MTIQQRLAELKDVDSSWSPDILHGAMSGSSYSWCKALQYAVAPNRAHPMLREFFSYEIA
jgi:hypothetical protein